MACLTPVPIDLGPVEQQIDIIRSPVSLSLVDMGHGHFADCTLTPSL